MGVVIDSTLRWDAHIERTCSRISHNLFIINRLAKMLNLKDRRMLYYGLIYPFFTYGIAVWGQSAKALIKRVFILQKRTVRYTTGLKPLESCRDSFKQLKILTVYSLYIQQTILHVINKCNCMVNKYTHMIQETIMTSINVCIIWNFIPANPQLQVVFFIINCQIV